MNNKVRELLKEILKFRGINEDEMEEFLSDKPVKTYDPFLMKDLGEAVNLIIRSIEANDKICIYGDYDADGITSTALMLQFLSNFTKNLNYYIPSRFDEGYGLNCDAIREIAKAGNQLIITVDCGSISYEEVELAKELGLKVVVTDHHSIGNTKADCILVNPQNKECNYPFKKLAGVGVAFKVAQGICRKMGADKKYLSELLDLVAIGTVGDVMPLIDENRTLVKYGLKKIHVGTRLGLNSLIKKLSLEKGKITSRDIAFGIVPPINAGGRMGNAQLGVELLMESDEEEMMFLAEEVIENNNLRRNIQNETYLFCKDIVKEYEAENKFLIIDAGRSHEGITGIVAGKIKDDYNKPTVILTESEDNYLKGTGRSIEGVDLFHILDSQKHLFEKFGGHKMACGFLMKKENLDLLKKGVDEKIYELDKKAIQVDSIKYDVKIKLKDIDFELFEALEKLEPCGKDNPKATVFIENVKVENIKNIGDGGKHLKFIMQDSSLAKVEAIAFNKAVEFSEILKEKLYDNIGIVGKLNKSLWNGEERLQIVVEQIV